MASIPTPPDTMQIEGESELDKQRRELALEASNPEARAMIERGLLGNRTHITKDGKKKPVVGVSRDVAKKLLRTYHISDEESRKKKEEAEEKLAQYMANALTITDPSTGERRLADVGDEKDRAILYSQSERPVYVKTAGNTAIQNRRTAMFSVAVPPELKAGMNGLIPIALESITAARASYVTDADSIIAQLPLISIPMYTPKLLAMVTGQPQYAVSESFEILRAYILVSKLLSQSGHIPSRKEYAIKYIATAIDTGTLTEEALRKFVENTTVVSDKKQFVHPEDLLLYFKHKQLKSESVTRLEEFLIEVLPYEGAPYDYHVGSDGFLEDIVHDCGELRDTVSAQYAHQFESGKEEWALSPENMQKFMQIMFSATHDLICTYEQQIMRMIGIKALPLEYRSSLSIQETPADPSHIEGFLAKRMFTTRARFANARFALVGMNLFHADTPDLIRIAAGRGYPDSIDIEAFSLFLSTYGKLLRMNDNSEMTRALIRAETKMVGYYSQDNRIAYEKKKEGGEEEN